MSETEHDQAEVVSSPASASSEGGKATGRRSIGKHLPLLVLKIALSGTLLWYVMGRVGVASVFDNMQSLPLSVALLALGLLLFQVVVSGIRLRFLLSRLAYHCRALQMVRISFIGYFFSQTLFSFLSGDGVRIWRLSRYGIPVHDAAQGVFLERIVGLAFHLCFVTATLPFVILLSQNDTQIWSLIVLSASGLTGIALLFAAPALPAFCRNWPPVQLLLNLSVNLKKVFTDRRWAIPMLGYTMVINLTNVIVIYVFASGLGIDISFWQTLILTPAVLLLSMLPISFSGWGVREGAMVVAFGLVGVAPEKSLLVSVLFGISMLVVSLPGSLLWFQAKSAPEMDQSTQTDSTN